MASIPPRYNSSTRQLRSAQLGTVWEVALAANIKTEHHQSRQRALNTEKLRQNAGTLQTDDFPPYHAVDGFLVDVAGSLELTQADVVVRQLAPEASHLIREPRQTAADDGINLFFSFKVNGCGYRAKGRWYVTSVVRLCDP